jgi:hypothetical protein
MGLDSYMSRLTDKVTSYSHYKGISFDEPTYTLTPTRTGNKSPYTTMSDNLFVNDGTNLPTIVEGPMPGQNAYQFVLNPNTSTTSRLYYGSTSSGDAGAQSDIRRACYGAGPYDRVFGIWVKTPDGSANAGMVNCHRLLYGSTSVVMSVAVGKLGTGLPSIALNTPDLGYAAFSGQSQYGNAVDGYTPFEWNKWYFIAWRKQYVVNGNPFGGPTIGGTYSISTSYTLWINGIKTADVSNTINTTYLSVNMIEFGRNSSAFGNNTFAFANWFVGEWADYGEEAIKDIYKYGSPTNRPYQNADIRWTDGNTFYSASSEKVYRNGQWQDVFANRWDGANWLPI